MSYGLALIYGVMRIVNLAHAGVMMLAAYVTLTVYQTFGLEPYLAPLAVVPLIALQFFLSRTFLGKAIRATTQDRDSARLVGIDVDRISMIAFGIGIAMSALAGSLFAMILPFNPDFGRVLMLKSFAVIVLGGLTSFVGIAAGALVLALAEEWAVGVLGLQTSLKDLVSYTALVLVLILLPNGLPSLIGRSPHRRRQATRAGAVTTRRRAR